jgi:hypothetical protein
MQDTWQNYVMVPVLRIAPTYTYVEESFCIYTDSKWVSNFDLHIHKRVFLNPIYTTDPGLIIRLNLDNKNACDIHIAIWYHNYCVTYIINGCTASIMEVIENSHWFAAYQLTLQFVLKFVAYNIWSPCCSALPITMIKLFFVT